MIVATQRTDTFSPPKENLMGTQSRRLAIATVLIWIGLGTSVRVEAGGIS
jgi:hypothetical protein